MRRNADTTIGESNSMRKNADTGMRKASASRRIAHTMKRARTAWRFASIMNRTEMVNCIKGIIHRIACIMQRSHAAYRSALFCSCLWGSLLVVSCPPISAGAEAISSWTPLCFSATDGFAPVPPRVLFALPEGPAPAEGGETNAEAEFARMLKAARRGDPEAQNFVGRAYINGEGVARNYKEGVNWFRRGAEQAYAKSFFNLGICYENGYGTSKSLKRAFTWYELSAERGFDRGQFMSGVFLQEGWGTKKDLEAAREWYRRSAEQGYAPAQRNLAYLYFNGLGVDRDCKKAVQWFRKAAEQGDAKCQNNLGACLYDGLGVGQDRAVAVTWYEKAAEQGLAMAQCNLGELYMNGEPGVVERNDEEAFRWIERAAAQGHADALNLLGVLLLEGRGASKNRLRAHVCFSLAASQGNESAGKNLDTLTRELSAEEHAQAERLLSEWKPGDAIPEPAPPPVLEIEKLYFRPEPARRGEEGWICVHYHFDGISEIVHESWYLFHDGKLQFPGGPLEMSFIPKEKDLLREIPFPIPEGVPEGSYELRLEAERKGVTVTQTVTLTLR